MTPNIVEAIDAIYDGKVPKMWIQDPSGAEISWFAPLCNGDDDFLGNRNPLYKSSWENTSSIVKTAETSDEITQ